MTALGAPLGAALGTSLGTDLAATSEAPQIIPGLFAWWRADSGLTVDGSNKVSAWLDKTGTYTLSQGTAAAQPLYTASDADIGSRPALTFDGSNDCLISTSAASTWKFLHSTGGTVWISYYADSVFIEALVSTQDASTGVGVYVGADVFGAPNRARGIIGNGAASVADLGPSASIATEALWQSLRFDGTTGYLDALGGVSATGASASPSSSDPMYTLNVGRIGVPNFYAHAHIAEIAVYSRKITDVELAALAAYGAARYGY